MLYFSQSVFGTEKIYEIINVRKELYQRLCTGTHCQLNDKSTLKCVVRFFSACLQPTSASALWDSVVLQQSADLWLSWSSLDRGDLASFISSPSSPLPLLPVMAGYTTTQNFWPRYVILSVGQEYMTSSKVVVCHTKIPTSKISIDQFYPL